MDFASTNNNTPFDHPPSLGASRRYRSSEKKETTCVADFCGSVRRSNLADLSVSLTIHMVCLMRLATHWSDIYLEVSHLVANTIASHNVGEGGNQTATNVEPTAAMDTHVVNWNVLYPTIFYVAYLLFSLGYLCVASHGAVIVSTAACSRGTLATALLAWRATRDVPLIDVQGGGIVAMAFDIGVLVVLMVAIVVDLRILFDSAVGVVDGTVPVGMQRCVLCGETWEAGQVSGATDVDEGASLLNKGSVGGHRCEVLLRLRQRAAMSSSSGVVTAASPTAMSPTGGALGGTINNMGGYGGYGTEAFAATTTTTITNDTVLLGSTMTMSSMPPNQEVSVETFPSAESAGFLARWTFSWMNSFIHFAYMDPSRVFADAKLAPLVIPSLPSFMSALSNYCLPNVQLWRQKRLLNKGGDASTPSGSGSGGATDYDCGGGACSVVLKILSLPFRCLVVQPLSRLGKYLFMHFFVDEVTRVELQRAPYRSLYSLFLETNAGRRFMNVCVPLKFCQDLLAMTSPVIVSYLIHYIKAVNMTQHVSTPSTATPTSMGSYPHVPTLAPLHEVSRFIGDNHRTAPPILLPPSMQSAFAQADVSIGLLICSVMFATLVLQSLFFQNYLRHLYLSATEATTTIRCLILEKVLVTPLAALLSKEVVTQAHLPRMSVSEGSVVALCTVEAARCGETLIFLHNVWGHPIMVTASLALLSYYVGVTAAVCSFLTLVVMIPVNKRRSTKIQEAQSAAVGSGPRVSMINEVLSNMRLVKANVWEGFLLQKLVSLRREESACEETILKEEAAASFYSDGGAILVCCVCFAAYYVSGGALVAETLVPALAALNLLRFPIWSFPGLLSTVSRGIASMKKIDAFLGWSPESAAMTFQSTRSSSVLAGAIECRSPSSFSFTKKTTAATTGVMSRQPSNSPGNTSQPTSPTRNNRGNAGQCVLDGILLRVAPGQLVGIRGAVGTGKTALLLAIMGELAVTPGTNSAFPPIGSPAGSKAKRDFIAGATDAGFRVGGSIAYCSDTPWLRNESIRKNICMHIPYDAVWYQKVTSACALRADFTRFPHGDMTLVGDKGVQLSGGQKARVALARAVYGRYDIYLLDGILDALDAKSQNIVIKRCIEGLLRKKTRIVVSHVGLGLMHLDRTLEMHVGGTLFEVTADGKDLMPTPTPSTLFMRTPTPSDRSGSPASRASTQSPDESEDDDVFDDDSTAATTTGACTTSTAVKGAASSSTGLPVTPSSSPPPVFAAASGVVPLSSTMEHTLGRAKLPRRGRDTLAAYLFTFGWHGIVVLLTSVLYQALQTSMDVWFGFWISRRTTTGITFLGMYALLGLLTAMVSFLRTSIFFQTCVVVANRLLLKSLGRLMNAPASYFDVASAGTLTGILSKDVDILDRSVPESVRLLLLTSLQLIAIAIFNSALSPMFLVIIPFTVTLFYNVSMRFLRVSKEVRRLENRSVGGAVAILKEAYQGGPLIRTSSSYADAIRVEFCAALDVGNRARDVAEQLDRWVGLRLELVSTTLATTAAFLSVIYSAHIPPAFAGVAVVNCLNTSRVLLMLCRRIGMFQVQFMSVEQIMKLHHVPQEPHTLTVPVSAHSPSYPKQESFLLTHHQPAVVNPNKDEGEAAATTGFSLTHVSLKYRPQLPEYSLKDICLTIPRNKKVGLVGRSGSGKSTIFNAVLGLADIIEGSIVIHGHDVSHWERKAVRKQCLIVPQEPPLLKGTWRSNLRLGTREAMEVPSTLEALPTADLTLEEERHRDDEARMWRALHATGLDTKASPLLGLETAMEESGHNFSAGEKQLFCLARALMRDPPPDLVLLDEISAHVDDQTDAKIQDVIRTHFDNSTVLMIAHRLHTLQYCDYIVSLSDGVVTSVKERDATSGDSIAVAELE